MMTPDEYWIRFRDGFTAQGDSEEYIFAIRLAFYTGAMAVMTIVSDAAKADSPERSNAIMERAYDEIKASSDLMLIEAVRRANPTGEN
jgi:hypothetical protein